MPRTSKPLPDNVELLGFKQTKFGNRRSYYSVTCLFCGKARNITRHDHAVRLSNHRCKSCSNKNNHPQGEYRNIRISWFKKFESNSQTRSLEWSIDIDYLADLLESQENKCFFSGLPIEANGDLDKITASIDRIDNSKGYIPGNVHLVHKRINMMRGSLSTHEFVGFCQAVAQNKKW